MMKRVFLDFISYPELWALLLIIFFLYRRKIFTAVLLLYAAFLTGSSLSLFNSATVYILTGISLISTGWISFKKLPIFYYYISLTVAAFFCGNSASFELMYSDISGVTAAIMTVTVIVFLIENAVNDFIPDQRVRIEKALYQGILLLGILNLLMPFLKKWKFYVVQ